MFLVFGSCFGFLEVFLDSGCGKCFFPTSHRSIPERPCSLNFCNTFQLNSDLLLDMQLFDFSDFLGVFIQSHSGCKFERSSQSTHTHSASKFVN